MPKPRKYDFSKMGIDDEVLIDTGDKPRYVHQAILRAARDQGISVSTFRVNNAICIERIS
jgi:uncharacterized protein